MIRIMRYIAADIVMRSIANFIVYHAVNKKESKKENRPPAIRQVLVLFLSIFLLL